MKVPASYYFHCFTKLGSDSSGNDFRDAVVSGVNNVAGTVKNIFNTGTSLASIAAILGIGFLANQGVKNLLGMKPPGGFIDKFERGLLATEVLRQQAATEELAKQLAATQSSLRNRNIALLLGGLALSPFAASYLYKNYNDLFNNKQINQNDKNKQLNNNYYSDIDTISTNFKGY